MNSVQDVLRKRKKLDRKAFHQNAKIYKVMSNPKRLEILNSLVGKEMSVEAITKMLGARKSNVSQHLAVLRMNGLVNLRRNGQSVYYRIVDPRIVLPCSILYTLHRDKYVF